MRRWITLVSMRRWASSVPDPMQVPHASSAENLEKTALEWLEKGNQCWNDGDVNSALDAYQKSIWSKPTSNAYYNLGNCQTSLSKYQSATESYKQSLSLDPNRADAHVNSANVFAVFLKDYERALGHYEAAVRLSTQDGEIRFNYAVVLEFVGRLKDALREYETAARLGVERANQNIRNIKAKMSAAESRKTSKETESD